jgi:FtsP/CotA-like multicopper oxidase with cupredoxin domain
MNHITSTSEHTSRRRAALVGIAAVTAAMLATTVAVPVFGAGSTAPAGVAAPKALPSAAVQPAALPIRPAAALPTVDICATTGTAVLPNANPSGTAMTSSVNIWGYVSGDCTGTIPTVTLGGAPRIDATEGDTVTVVLHNNLAEPTGLSFQGQPLPTDANGVAPGSSRPYSFVATGAGTHLYQAGMTLDPTNNAPAQVAMGLYGVLVVHPAVAPVSGDPSYSNNETIVLISDIDPALNAAPTTFDMRNFKPKYQLLNGKAYPQTASLGTATPGDHLQVRYVNAGVNYHSMGILGGNQRIVADDGNALAQPYTVVAQTVGPGQTFDAIVDVSSHAVEGSTLAVYDANLQLRNKNRRPASKLSGLPYKTYGGALAFVQIGAPSSGDTSGPLVSGLTASATSAMATVSDATTGGNEIQAAQYRVDGGLATAIALPDDGVWGGQTSEGLTVTFASALDTSVSHTVYMRGQDSLGNLGPWSSTVVPPGATPDGTGPVTSGLSLTPNPTNGTVNVALHATGSDNATGGSNIVAAEYVIDGVPPAQSMAVNNPAVTASLDVTITAATVFALSTGIHTVSVRSQDSALNWGPYSSIMLTVDKTGPTTNPVTASPNPTNGVIGVNASTPAVRVTSSANDSSGVVRAEGFIDKDVDAVLNHPDYGTGFLFVPVDGAWGDTTEPISVDIPLTTINSLGEGPHTIYVHAKDTAGNWGATSSVTLTVDKTAPTISGVTLTPNTFTPGAATSTLAVTATDGTGVGVAGGQYWVDGTATPPANATAFTGTSVSITTAVLASGTYTVYVRVKDAAGNWSAVSSRPLYVVQAVNDTKSFNASTSNQTQQQNYTSGNGLLANDLPTVNGRTTRIASAPVRLTGTGTSVMTITCQGGTGNVAATPAISNNTVCTNGAFRVSLTAVGNNNPQRAANRRGTFQFTYTMTLNGVSSTATVTITVN